MDIRSLQSFKRSRYILSHRRCFAVITFCVCSLNTEQSVYQIFFFMFTSSSINKVLSTRTTNCIRKCKQQLQNKVRSLAINTLSSKFDMNLKQIRCERTWLNAIWFQRNRKLPKKWVFARSRLNNLMGCSTITIH